VDQAADDGEQFDHGGARIAVAIRNDVIAAGDF
jgi:hypothetical protein